MNRARTVQLDAWGSSHGRELRDPRQASASRVGHQRLGPHPGVAQLRAPFDEARHSELHPVAFDVGHGLRLAGVSRGSRRRGARSGRCLQFWQAGRDIAARFTAETVAHVVAALDRLCQEKADVRSLVLDGVVGVDPDERVERADRVFAVLRRACGGS